MIDTAGRRDRRMESRSSNPSLSPATTFSASSSSGGIAGRFASAADFSAAGFTSAKWRRKA
jgi:hypothetical protein